MFLYNIPRSKVNANCFVVLSLAVMLIMVGKTRGDGSSMCVCLNELPNKISMHGTTTEHSGNFLTYEC